MYSFYLNPVVPLVSSNEDCDVQPQPLLQMVDPIKAPETRVDVVSCVGTATPTNDPKHEPPETVICARHLDIPGWPTEGIPRDIIPRFSLPFNDLPFRGFFGGMLSPSDTGRWTSRSDDVYDAGDSAATSGRSTPFTEHSDLQYVTTARTQSGHISLSSLWAWFRSKEVTAAGKTPEIKEKTIAMSESADILSQDAGLTIERNRTGGCLGDRSRDGPVIGHCVEIDSCCSGPDENPNNENVPERNRDSVQDDVKSACDYSPGLDQNNCSTTEENYWKWDQGRQQFIHKDANTGKTVVCPNLFD